MGFMKKIGRFIFLRKIEAKPPIEDIIEKVEEVKPAYIKKEDDFLQELVNIFRQIEHPCENVFTSMPSAIYNYYPNEASSSIKSLFEKGVSFPLVGSDEDEPSLSLLFSVTLHYDLVINIVVNNVVIIKMIYVTGRYPSYTYDKDIFNDKEGLWNMVSDKILSHVLDFFVQMDTSLKQVIEKQNEERRIEKNKLKSKVLNDLDMLKERLES